MIPAIIPNTSMDKGQEFLSKLGGGDGNHEGSDNLLLGGEDPFNDSAGGDFFDKFMADEAAGTMNSVGLGDSSNLLASANDSSFQLMLDSTLEKSDSMNLDLPKDTGDDLMAGAMKPAPSLPSAGQSMLNKPLTLGSGMMNKAKGMGQTNLDGSNWQQRQQNQSHMPSMNPSGNSMLDAAPLNITLGGASLGNSAMGGSRLGNAMMARTGMGNTGMGSAGMGNTGLGNAPLTNTPSSGSLTATLRRKSSSSQLSSSKLNAVRKVNLTSSKLRNTKSEGMLARALKARYNSGNNLNKYNVNAATASAVISGKLPRNALSAMAMNSRTSNSALAQHMSNSVLRGSQYDLTAVETEGESGSKNATWGAPAARKPGGAMFASLLSGSGSSAALARNGLSSSGSSASLMRKQSLSASGSRSSMQDLLRLSKRQSKTQSMLRQSSAQHLRKQAALQTPNKVDLTSLLPPEHAAQSSQLGTKSSLSPLLNNMQGQQNAPGGSQAGAAAASLLHQSCRLYPTTKAVVESALRMDPQAVRKAVAVPLEKGQPKKPQHLYGYPVNIAMTHGGSLEVIQMLAEAAPDVLVQKDGNDGSGSLGIALMHKADMQLINMLVQANPECVMVADRRGNYPLHVAVNNGLTPQVVKQLVALYPKALQMRNFHSQTPLEIAQRSTRCPEEIMNYLQSVAFSSLETTAHHLDEAPEPSDLEDGLDDIMKTNF